MVSRIRTAYIFAGRSEIEVGLAIPGKFYQIRSVGNKRRSAGLAVCGSLAMGGNGVWGASCDLAAVPNAIEAPAPIGLPELRSARN